MSPFFSIVMPVYNVEAVFPASLASVLAQDDRDFEVILVDDGSSDRSGQLCDAYASQYSFIRVVHKANGGLASARNAGIEAARGQYILMPDSDDTIEPDTLSAVRSAIDEAARLSPHPADLVRYNLQRHEGDRESVFSTDVPEGLYTGDGMAKLLDIALLEPKRFPLSACTHAYRRAFLEENQLRFISEREVLSEDFLFMLCAMIVAKSMYITNKTLYHYICREGSLTRSHAHGMLVKYSALYERLMAFAFLHSADRTLCQKISAYYINNLVYGNCIVYEYRVYPGHSWADARQNVKRMLKNKTVKRAAANVYRPALNFKQVLRTVWFRMGWEAPLAFTMREWKNKETG